MLPCDCVQINDEVKMARKELKKAQSIMQLDELKCRKRVLRRYSYFTSPPFPCCLKCSFHDIFCHEHYSGRLGYANASDVIEMKGRVACEISR